ncbi:MAG: PaaI family thioesterase [Burkholderiales bacterium]|nr:PaaI family thioesterase [Burkholderiales bacterium]
MSADGAAPLIAALFSGRIRRPPVGDLLGTEYLSYDLARGEARLRFTALPTFLNPAGKVNGGMLAAMLDELLAVTLTAAMREGEYNVTLDLGARFLKPAVPGAIDGVGHVIKRGRSVGFVEGELRDAAGTLLVRGHATMQIQAAAPPAFRTTS